VKIEFFKGSNVISMMPLRTQKKFPAISQVEAYWEALRNGRLMPARSEIDPRGISDVLEYAFILEKIAPGMARIRLAGHHLNDLLGMEVRAMPITALFLPEARRGVQRALESVFEAPASARLSLTGNTGMTRPSLQAHMFLAPLKDEEGKPTRIFGALQAAGKIGRAPRRFNIQDAKITPLLSDDPLQTSALPARAPGFGEAAQPFEPAPVKGAQHLRLVPEPTKA